MRILVTGGTGFLGGHLVPSLLGKGHQVTVLSRRAPARDVAESKGLRVVTWNPEREGGWSGELSRADGVVHLAAEQAVGVRWTRAARERIRSSRVDVTRRLVEAIGAASPAPRVLVSASAVGFYGPQPASVELDEQSARGSGFLADVCAEWEAAASAAETLGVRVVRARCGVVFGRDGGALPKFAAPFRFFAGGPIGRGDHVLSWIHVADAVSAMVRCLEDAELEGPVNVTAPEAVTGSELAHTLARTLGGRSWLPAPALALRLLFGEGAEPLLTGQRVRPRALLEHGFSWEFPGLEAALKDLLA